MINIKKKASIQGAESDPGAESRKSDHIQLAFDSQIRDLDQRFHYEPLMAAHPSDFPTESFFLAKPMKAPIWISSMTGGTEGADSINKRLARACGEFSLGMGLGSCRSLLYSDSRFADFDVRAEMGEKALLFANLGIAQIEKSLAEGAEDQILRMVDRLRADGLIIHVNPFQEWLQPEGDRITKPPIETIIQFLDGFPKPVIVKEVGQGMGPASLEALMKLPLAAIDFGAHGGTNFSKLELLRGTEDARDTYNGLSYVGHRATEMVETIITVRRKLGSKVKCQTVIASGGVGDYLDGYYLISKLTLNGVGSALYGQGSAFLRPAKASYAALQTYISSQIKGLALAEAYLTVKQ
ncbi:MAG: isopentenyl-diphosphate delta-isomerase [Limisphaerales bacterium]|jgi:isopentenyl-diphosphate delta-isomerase